MDKTDHLMAEKNKNNKDSQKGQVTPKKYFFLNTGGTKDLVVGSFVIKCLHLCLPLLIFFFYKV
jgi:hypothetical protein